MSYSIGYSIASMDSEYSGGLPTPSQPQRTRKPVYEATRPRSISMDVSLDYTPSSIGKVQSLRASEEVIGVPVTSLSEEAEKHSLTLTNLIQDSLRELGAPVLSTEARYDEKIGFYILAVLECSARQALRYWMNIVDEVKVYGIPVFIDWTGDTDVTPEEMGMYLGMILAEMNVFPATREPIDVVRILKEEWGE